MTKKIRKVHYPGSVEELVALLNAGEGSIAPVGGGVSFSFSVPSGVSELASLQRLGMKGIRLDNDGLHLGADATMTDLILSEVARGFLHGVISETASLVGATPNRNLITAGGNAVRVFLWSDLPAVYRAVGARFRVRGAGGARVIEADGFYAKQPMNILHHSEFLEEIIIPAPLARAGAAFEKFSETRNTFALLTAAAFVSCDESGKCIASRLVFGGLGALPVFAPRAGELLLNRKPDPALLREAVEEGVKPLKMVRDNRVSIDYKRELAVVIGCRVVEKACRRAGGDA